LRVILHEAGYAVSPAETLRDALDLAAREPPAAAIVDLMLPDGNGIELCRELRSWSTMPIVVLSAVDEEDQKVLALQAGADDYVTKPFSPRELVARLEALFRRAADGDDEPSVFVRGLEINFAAHTVTREGREIGLTPTEFNLLSVLARNRGRLVTSGALLAQVWGPTYGEDTPLLRTHMANLRRKLEDGGRHPRVYIKTEPGLGYRFTE
jgi:two-component system, OmpR family, KDP operon response regulator KdpE